MKVLITGAEGMLGRTLCNHLQGVEVIATNRSNADITDAKQFDDCINQYKPDVVIHCAAMTAVDCCESEIDLAYKVNVIGTTNVAASCHRHGVKLIAISTDYVFDGNLNRPYTEFDLATGGGCVYGQSKWAAEEAVRVHCPNHIIARVSWLYGAGGPSFVHTMLRLADGSRPILKVVNDQKGNPTSTIAVCRKIQELLLKPELVGTYHLTCEGEATWYEFANKIFEFSGVNQKVVSCSSDEFPTKARRPHNSCLDKLKLRLVGLSPMPHWENELYSFLQSEMDSTEN